MISVNGVKVSPTIFPDKTSQVWKLPEDLLQKIYKEYTCTITWEFESENEFLHLAQLKTLLDTYCDVVNLDMPYLPYARQDKRVENGSTFALHAFAKILNALNFNEVYVVDAHNNQRANMINGLVDVTPREAILSAYKETKADTFLFPDAGARTRYSDMVHLFGAAPQAYADKVRDQATGRIERITITGRVKDKTILIVDDLCDGGMTFKLVAEQTLKDGAKEVHLYVTHGIFSQGLETLRKSGIDRIFTHKGERPKVDVQLSYNP